MAKSGQTFSFPLEKITDKLRFDNPWWASGKTDDEFTSKRRRLYFNLFAPLVADREVRRAVVLMGPRRVGKTVMLQHTIQSLIDDGASAHKIAFINIENPIYTNIGLEELFSLAQEAVGRPDPRGWYVFFDEIQYLKNWEVHLKVLVDSYPETKFAASGSAAAALRLKSDESGAGRFTDFMLPPLTFNEYIHLTGLEQLIIPSSLQWKGNAVRFSGTPDIKTLNRHFINYMNYGGYPEIIFSEQMQRDPGRYVRSDIVDKVLLRDLPSLYGIKDVQELNRLFTTLAYHTGNEISIDGLCKGAGIEKYTLKKYIDYLEAAFLIKVVHRIDDTAKKFQRAHQFKVYLTNPGLRSALFSPIDAADSAIGAMVESAIFAQWLHSNRSIPWYAAWKNGEVDMVGLNESNLKPIWALEIKWSNRFFEKPAELKSLLHFCRQNKLTSALVTTIDLEGSKTIDGVELTFIPAALYAYVVGNNAIDRKLGAT